MNDSVLVKAWDDALAASQDRTWIIGRLGAREGGTYLIDVPDRPGEVYVSLGVNGERGQTTATNKIGATGDWTPIKLRRENGRLVIREADVIAAGGGSSTLAALTDVALASTANGDVLTYNTASGKWINSAPGGGSGAPSPHALSGVHHSGLLNWADLNKTGSSLADLASRAHSSLTGVGLADHHDLVTAGNTGLSVAASPSQVVSLNLATDPGLEIISGVRVKAYYGITRDSNGVGVKLKTTSGLEVDTNGLAIDLDTTPGLALGAGGIKVLLDPTASGLQLTSGLAIADTVAGAGLAITSKVLNVVAANGSITVNANDLNVNLAHAFNWTATHTWDTSVLVVNTSTDTVSIDTSLFVANAATDIVTFDTTLVSINASTDVVTFDTTLFVINASTDLVTIDTNLFYADAPNNRIGINRTPGNAALDVIVTTNADHTQRLKQKSGQTGRLWRIEDADGNELIVLDSQGNLQSGKPGFVSGLTGWQMTPTGNLEANNGWFRGELHASVFVKDEVHIGSGTTLFATGSKLYSDADIDATTSDLEELEIESTAIGFGDSLDITTTQVGFAGTTLFVESIFNYVEIEDSPTGPGFYFEEGETIRSKTEVDTGVADFWFTVLGKKQFDGYQRYSVIKRSGTDGVLPAGAGIGSWGFEGDGRVLITSDFNYAPYLDVFTIGPNVWSGAAGSTIPHVRLGRLDGVGVTAVSGIEQYGIIAGTDLSNANSPYAVLSNTQLRLHRVPMTLNDGTNDTGEWTATGNLTVGTNIGVTAGKAFSVQTTGTDAGDVIVGDHTLAGNYLKWDKSAGTLTINGALSVGGAGVATISYVDGEIVLVDAGAAAYAAAAQAAAISTASGDATTKANAAQAAAEAAASAYGNARRVVGVSGTFTSTDADTITWTSVSVRFGNGTTKTITNGNTGNMAARTYLYVDATAAAPLTLSATTSIASIGANNALIAVCDPGTDKASVSIVAGSTYISGDNIITGSIVAANIKAGAITATEISAGVFTTVNAYADSAASGALSSAQTYTDTINSYRALGVDGTFTSTDADTITWTSVSVRKANGSNITITNGNTGNMAARTWLYILYNATSPATMQMQTSIGSIPANAIIVGVATPATASGQASIVLLPGRTMITGDQIVTGSIIASNIKAGAITANEIAANTITAAKIAANTITAAKIAANTITATEIAAFTITSSELATGSVTASKISVSSLNAVSAAVDGAIVMGTSGRIYTSGKTTFADSDPGFFLGWDTVTTSAYKFSVGDGNTYMRWNGTNLVIHANQPVSIVADGSNQVLQFENGGFADYITYDGTEIGIPNANLRLTEDLYARKLFNTGDTMRIVTARTVASSGATGFTGEICWDSNYLYVCVGTNTWRRIPMFSGGTYW